MRESAIANAEALLLGGTLSEAKFNLMYPALVLDKQALVLDKQRLVKLEDMVASAPQGTPHASVGADSRTSMGTGVHFRCPSMMPRRYVWQWQWRDVCLQCIAVPSVCKYRPL
jgi:hypothetical protein